MFLGSPASMHRKLPKSACVVPAPTPAPGTRPAARIRRARASTEPRTCRPTSTTRSIRGRRPSCRISSSPCGAACGPCPGPPRAPCRSSPGRPPWPARAAAREPARRGTCPPCRRTWPPCCGSRRTLWRSAPRGLPAHVHLAYILLCAKGHGHLPFLLRAGLAKVFPPRGNIDGAASLALRNAAPSCDNCSIPDARGARYPVRHPRSSY